MARWLRMLLPALVVVAWLAAAGLGGPTFGKLSDVSTNDQAGFLPASAESTTAGEWQERFRDSDAAGRPSPSSNSTSRSSRSNWRTTPRWPNGWRTRPAWSAAVRIKWWGRSRPKTSKRCSSSCRCRKTWMPARWSPTCARSWRPSFRKSATGYVTGPAGFIADLVEAFGGIDGLLLGVALGAVFVILLLVYRALLLPFLVLLTSVFALCAAILVVYWFALQGWIQLSGQSQGILSILIGAATDYALLLTARYREALGEHESKWAAMKTAYRGAVEPIAASGATVILALLCLLFSDLNSNRSLGPIAAIGIVFAVLAALTFLPAVLLLTGRSAFWPIVPRPGHRAHVAPPENAVAGTEGMRGLWLRVANLVARMPRATWMVSVLLLVAGAMGVLQLQAHGVPQSELVLVKTDSADGQDALVRHFDAGAAALAVVVADSGQAGPGAGGGPQRGRGRLRRVLHP